MATPKLRTLPNRVRTLDTRTARPAAKTADQVYQTPEYQKWRAVVLARAKGCCQDAAHSGPNPWPGKLYPDHIKEIQDGGAVHDPNNGLARCASCHTRKTSTERAKRHAMSET